MTEQEKKAMLFLEDTIHIEIHTMFVTNDLAELNTMALYARNNIGKLEEMRYRAIMEKTMEKIEEVKNGLDN